MARLGGARVGMGAAVFGPKPDDQEAHQRGRPVGQESGVCSVPAHIAPIPAAVPASLVSPPTSPPAPVSAPAPAPAAEDLDAAPVSEPAPDAERSEAPPRRRRRPCHCRDTRSPAHSCGRRRHRRGLEAVAPPSAPGIQEPAAAPTSPSIPAASPPALSPPVPAPAAHAHAAPKAMPVPAAPRRAAPPRKKRGVSPMPGVRGRRGRVRSPWRLGTKWTLAAKEGEGEVQETEGGEAKKAEVQSELAREEEVLVAAPVVAEPAAKEESYARR
ncbi:hypothetical protein B0H14DRAFT_209920 [Mycena olivaceomarginata]|nr:hypothetical protein B0H14DRAFT_209920 [Mycena olivaceomarginata]